jgi:hypothetical protein
VNYFHAALLCLVPIGLASAQSVQLKMPHSGDTQVVGTVVGATGNSTVRVTRTHSDGRSEQATAAIGSGGAFSASLPVGDKLIAGDKISVAVDPVKPADGSTPPSAQVQPALPAVTQVVPTSPPIVRFAASLNQTRGAQIAVAVTSNPATAGWPSSFIGNKTVTVIADDAIQFDSTVQATGTLPQASTLQVALSPPGDSGATATTVEDPLCEWGRVRCYVYFGAIFSQTNGDFSSADPYLDFNLEWNWFKGKHSLFTGFFDTRLSTIPTPANPAAAGSTSSSATNAGTTNSAQASTPSAVDAFAASSKSPQVFGGFYYAPWAGPVWTYKDQQYGFFAAMLYKGGVQGKLDGSVVSSSLSFPDQDKSIFTFNAAGARLGFVKWHPESGEAHDLLSYIDFSVGKYRLYDFIGPDFQDAPGGASDVRHYGLRKVVEARIKIPSTNVRLGVDANLGQGQNDLRFSVTTNAIDMLKSLFGQR